MSVLDPYLVNVDLDVHLRDARHAHQLFTEYGHAFAPKQKFLYHVVFQPHREIGNATLQNTIKFQKEIGVLAKSLDLPSFRASIENKQQYNRKKNIQTRVDYQDINIRLHDDNTGATRGMLEDYYKWYFVDGRQTIGNTSLVGPIRGAGGAYNPRDKYSEIVPQYGLNALNTEPSKQVPFYEYIKIYQLARKKWFSYTLVNPLLSAWQHGDLEYGDGAGLMENTITVAYESVLYNNGTIGEDGEPATFTSQESLYDNVPSPQAYPSGSISEGLRLQPKLLNQNPTSPQGVIARAANSASTPAASNLTNNSSQGVLEQIVVPTASNNAPSTSSTSSNTVNVPLKSGDELRAGLANNINARTAFIAKAINSQTIIIDSTGVNSFLDYKNLPAAQRNAIMNDAIDRAAGGDQKLAQFASNAIAANV
tara:strand:+ start:385 stop:1653 length:1269 start_codon:yes stop_codon:yes gene_type:complete